MPLDMLPVCLDLEPPVRFPIPDTPQVDRLLQAKTLHAILGLALEDFIAVMRDPRYMVDLVAWHEPGATEFDRCTVCLAGAVMAGRLGAPIDQSVDISDYTAPITGKLAALDNLRVGYIEHARCRLYGHRRSGEVNHTALALSQYYRPQLIPFSKYTVIGRKRAPRFLNIMFAMQRELVRAGL